MAIGKVVGRMDKEEAEKVLATAAKVTSVDKSAPTIMCVVGLVEAISKQWGPDITALLCLPVLAPLMVASSLTHQQFGILTRCGRTTDFWGVAFCGRVLFSKGCVVLHLQYALQLCADWSTPNIL